MLFVSASSGRASAQAWSAQLVIAPLPSPHLSDWEIDPTIGQLIVTNPRGTATDVTFHYTVTRNGRMLLRGTTDPQTIPGNESVVFNGTSTFGGRADWDRDVQQTIARTGKLPEGEYEGCVTISGPGGIVLVERQCARFTTQSSDPPFLVLPANGDTLTSRDPIFEWQPVQLPAMSAARVGYVLQIAEVRTSAGQRPEVALESNILHYVEPNLIQTSHQYPVGALPLVSGRTYAWRVQALDGDGKPAATNQGRSEIWTFVYRETETEVVARTVARLELTPQRDTLRYPGDTSRYEVTAYDADNVEIAGKRIAWRSIDTTIARIDSTGAVTSVAVGETRIVASVDGVADSALSVTAAATSVAVGFEFYDARTDKPALLELINSGSFEEVLPRLMELLQSGEFRIPIPRLPGASSGSGDGDARDDVSSRQSGPHVPTSAKGGSYLPAECDEQRFLIQQPHVDHARKIIAYYVPLNTQQRQALTGCLGMVTKDHENVPDGEVQRGVIHAISYEHPGLPRAFLIMKGPGFGLTLLGPKVRARYLVINISRPITIDSKVVPSSMANFFGDDSFEAGLGVTYYSVRTCVDDAGPLCPILRWINPTNPDITIQAFAGVTASETSIGGGSKGAAVGTSLALGFSIQATLPVRKWDADVGGVSLDSTQVGLMFAGQDSIVAAAGEGVGHNYSLSASPTITVWWSRAGGNQWEFSGSIGLEVDPSKPRQVPKLVVAGLIPSTWKLWKVRLGNPQIVFTRMLEVNGTMDLGLSGNWGIGPWNGSEADAVGVDTDGGGIRGDAGGASIGGTSGFEELGRGAVILKWEKRSDPGTALPTAGDVESAKKALADAKTRHQSLEAKAKELETRCVDLRRRFDALLARGEPSPFVEAQRDETCAAAHTAREETLKALSAEHEASSANRAVRQAGTTTAACPDGGSLVSAGKRCFTWTAQLSLGNGAIIDLISLAVRNWMGNQ